MWKIYKGKTGIVSFVIESDRKLMTFEINV